MRIFSASAVERDRVLMEKGGYGSRQMGKRESGHTREGDKVFHQPARFVLASVLARGWHVGLGFGLGLAFGSALALGLFLVDLCLSCLGAARGSGEAFAGSAGPFIFIPGGSECVRRTGAFMVDAASGNTRKVFLTAYKVHAIRARRSSRSPRC